MSSISQLKGLNIISTCFAIFHKGKNLSDICLPILRITPLLETILSKGSKFFLLEYIPFLKLGATILTELSPLNVYAFTLS